MAVSFTYTATTVQLQNPVRSNKYARRAVHALGRTAGGQLYRYSKGVTLKRITLEFTEIRDVEKAAFESFFFTTVSGPTTDFTYVDHDGVSWNARFIRDTVDFEEIADAKLQDGFLVVGAEQYPSTRRKNPIWRFELEMEVW